MTETIPACSSCKYYEGNDFICMCFNPEYSIRKVNYIKGEIYYEASICSKNRADESKCGPEARGWIKDPNPEPEYQPIFWRGIKQFIKGLICHD